MERPNPPSPFVDFLLLLVSIGSLIAFYGMPWVTGINHLWLLGERFGPVERTGWELLEWAGDYEVSIYWPLWAILIAVPLAGLIVLVRLYLMNRLATSPRNLNRTSRLAWLGLIASGVNAAALGYLFSEIDAEDLLAGYWVAAGSGAGLAVGFLLRLKKPAALATPPVTQTPSATGEPGAPPGNARLIVHSGLMEGACPRITETPFTMGRQEHNKLVLFDDLTVSRQHAVVLYHNGAYFLRAVTPSQPLWVGKNPGELHQQLSWRLESRDVFAIGESLIEFVVE